MPDIGAGLQGLGSAADSLFGGIGQLKAAKGYKKAAAFSDLSAQISAQATALEVFQAQRDVYRAVGGASADYGKAGLALSGSALDVLRDSASQGALTTQLVQANGQLKTTGFQAEAEAYRSMAAAAKAAGKGGILGGLLKGAAAAASMFALSDDRMKERPVLIERRRDGLGIWEFNYRGQPTRFRGVMASEVQRLYPLAVEYVDGWAHVDYGKIGVTPEVAV